MIDPFAILAPVLLLAVIALLRFVGCSTLAGIDDISYAPPAAPPTFDLPQDPTYYTPQSVILSDATPGATIYYTTDGSPPATKAPFGSTQIYGIPIPVPTPTSNNGINTIKAIAAATGFQESAVATGTYKMVTADPTFDPLSPGQTVTLRDATPGASIYYSTDGSPPTKLYTGPIPVLTTTTIKAKATLQGFQDSPVVDRTYTISVAPTAIGFVQVNDPNLGTPQTPPNVQSVSVPYPNPQTAGNLNVVVVGWNDAASNVAAVSDDNNNPYTLAFGPTRGTNLSQSIYYARSIKAGPNTVTVKFNQPVPFPDVRVLEYQGVSAPDGPGAGNIGNSATTSCGPVTTSVANELIFAANTVATRNSGPGSGFTQRIITVGDGDLAEDRVVSAIGSYSADATLASPGPWVMQMVAFK